MNAEKNRYRIVALKHKRSFSLRSGIETLGSLTLHGVHRSTAELLIQGKLISLKRTATVKKDILVKSGMEEFHFHSDMFSRGEISIRTHNYFWSPSNIRWNSWTWKNRHGDVLMEIKIHRSFTGIKGEVISDHPLDTIWKMELALIGWYLLLLGHGRPGIHLLSALKVATSGT